MTRKELLAAIKTRFEEDFDYLSNHQLGLIAEALWARQCTRCPTDCKCLRCADGWTEALRKADANLPDEVRGWRYFQEAMMAQWKR